MILSLYLQSLINYKKKLWSESENKGSITSDGWTNFRIISK